MLGVCTEWARGGSPSHLPGVTCLQPAQLYHIPTQDAVEGIHPRAPVLVQVAAMSAGGHCPQWVPGRGAWAAADGETGGLKPM